MFHLVASHYFATGCISSIICSYLALFQAQPQKKKNKKIRREKNSCIPENGTF